MRNQQKTHRILLYGASNLWLSRRAALTELRRRFEGTLQIGLALGPGRSYGLNAGNPLIRYEALSQVDFGFGAESVNGRKLAFITDIGNDIAYSQRPERIVAWVRELTQRLESQGFEVMVGGVPAESLALIHPTLFKTCAKLYYPEGNLSKDQITRDLEELEYGIQELCAKKSYPHFGLSSDWYGLDRFHLKRRARIAYWRSLLSTIPERTRYRSTWSYAIRRPLFPERYWLVGKEKMGQSRYLDLVPDSITLVR